MRGYLFLTGLLSVYCWAYGFEMNAFRIPTNHSSGILLSASTNFADGSFGQDSRETNGDYGNGSFRANGYYHFDSEELTWKVVPEITVGGNWHGNDYRNLNANSTSDGTNSRTYMDQTFSLFGGLIYYPHEGQWGLEAAVDGQIREMNEWSHQEGNWNDLNYPYSSVLTSDGNEYALARDISLEAGVGWGKIRNGAGVYKTYYLEKWLRDLNLLHGELSAATREKLIELAYLQGNYVRSHERAGKYYWRDVEAILKDDPAFTGALDAYAVMKLSEAGIGYSVRPSGFRFGLYPRFLYYDSREYSHDETFEFRNYDGEQWYDTLRYESVRSRSATREFIIGPRVLFCRPIGYRWQVNAESGLDRRVCSPDRGFAFNNYFTASYDIFDRMSLRYSMEHLRWLDGNLDRDATRGSSWAIVNRISAYYFLEDQVYVSLSVEQTQYRYESYTPNLADYYDSVEQSRQHSVYFSLTYRLGGNGLDMYGTYPRQGFQRMVYDYPSKYDGLRYIGF